MARLPLTAEGRSASLVEVSAMALAIGIVTGLAGVLFRAIVAAIHDFFFLGEFSLYYDPNIHTPASWLGPLVIFSPVVGGLVVIFLSRLPPADRRGQGVSDIIDAIYYREGRVRSLQAFVKSLAAGIQSGSGGSVGREAAIVQIGAAIASRAARFTNLAQWQRMTLVAAGGASGLAAAFNAPLGSIVFAVELMMPEISPRTLLPVTMAAGAGTFVARIFYGLQPTFLVQTVVAPELRVSGVLDLLPFVFFGLLLGVTSWVMIRGLSWTEALLNKLTTNPYLKHAFAMLLVGLMIYGMKVGVGDYLIEGPSYAALQDILRGTDTALWFFALLFVAKLVATTLTLASGGSGGVFSASLIIGAALGGVVGTVTQMLMPQLNVNIPDYAIVGMAGMLGGTTGAAMTAIVMVFELTRDYNVIVPLIMVVTLAIAVRKAVLPQSIYTLKLADKGHEVPDSLQANMYRIRAGRARDDHRFRAASGRCADRRDDRLAGRDRAADLCDDRERQSPRRLCAVRSRLQALEAERSGAAPRRSRAQRFRVGAAAGHDVLRHRPARAARRAPGHRRRWPESRAARRRYSRRHRARDHGRGGNRECARLCAASRAQPVPAALSTPRHLAVLLAAEIVERLVFTPRRRYRL